MGEFRNFGFFRKISDKKHNPNFEFLTKIERKLNENGPNLYQMINFLQQGKQSRIKQNSIDPLIAYTPTEHLCCLISNQQSIKHIA